LVEQEREAMQEKQKRTEENLARTSRDLQSLQSNSGAAQAVVQPNTQETQEEEDDTNSSLGSQVNSQAADVYQAALPESHPCESPTGRC
jgi:hypothetical protein